MITEIRLIDADTCCLGEAIELDDKFEILRRQRVNMGWIRVKAVRTDKYVFRIGSLEDHKATGPHYAMRMLDKIVQHIWRKVFYDVKPGYQSHTIVWLARNMAKTITNLDT
ncbi:hypothetical protein AGR1B_Lc50458 [Agrobacterium fabacearum S56]|nr:hypothetical protein AGR1B_Lc50458 [Agrobacterium fabacearum S56]